MLSINIIPCLNDNYSYLLHDKETNTVAIVDPSDFNTCNHEIERKYKKLDYILNTHHHFDHVGGNKELKKKYGAIDRTYTHTMNLSITQKECN